jgi:cytochrome P450
MATTKSKQQHQRLRELFSPMLTDASMSRMLPKIQGSVQRYMQEWAARGTVPAYTETLTLMFDVLVRCIMGARMRRLVQGVMQAPVLSCEMWRDASLGMLLHGVRQQQREQHCEPPSDSSN